MPSPDWVGERIRAVRRLPKERVAVGSASAVRPQPAQHSAVRHTRACAHVARAAVRVRRCRPHLFWVHAKIQGMALRVEMEALAALRRAGREPVWGGGGGVCVANGHVSFEHAFPPKVQFLGLRGAPTDVVMLASLL